MTINPATLTYVANAASKVYGSANPSFTGLVTGFVNGDTQGSATSGAVAFGSTATPASHVGPYAIDGSGLSAANYVFQQSPSNATALTVDPAMLTATIAAANKVYDGTTATTGSITLNGILSGDNVTVADDAYAFLNKNAGAGKTVTESGAVLSGPGASDYTLGTVGTTTATILPKTLTATTTAASKTYDGAPTTTGSMMLNGVVSGDSVSVSHDSYAFTDKNAGTGKTVLESGAGLIGTDAGNYTLGTVATALADILPRAITGAVVGSDKVFDGTVSDAAALTLSGVVSGDVVAPSATFVFGDPNAGKNKAVSVAAAALTGTDARNYVLGPVSPGTANITAVAVPIYVNNASATAGQVNAPVFSASYNGSAVPGVNIADLLAGLFYWTTQPNAATSGTFQILASTANQNVALIVTPGILSVLAATPAVDPSLANATTSTQTNSQSAPSGISPIVTAAPNITAGAAGSTSYSSDWTPLIRSTTNNNGSISSASFIDQPPNGGNQTGSGSSNNDQN